jgi:hypothetical protein
LEVVVKKVIARLVLSTMLLFVVGSTLGPVGDASARRATKPPPWCGVICV